MGLKDPEARRAYEQMRYRRDKEKRIAGLMRSRAKNPEVYKRIRERWDAAHPERRQAIKDAWEKRRYAQDREGQKSKVRAWQKKNRFKVALYKYIGWSRRRARPGRATRIQIAARLAYWGWRCWMCGGAYEEIDHVKPLAKEGSNWPANLRPICKSCNSRKRHRWPL